MKRVLTVLLSFSILSTYSQNLQLVFKEQKGKLFIKDADGYLLLNAYLAGPKEKKEWQKVEEKISKDPYVKKFCFLSDNFEGERRIILIAASDEEPQFVDFLKRINIEKIKLNEKEFSIDQRKEFKEELKKLRECNKNRNERHEHKCCHRQEDFKKDSLHKCKHHQETK